MLRLALAVLVASASIAHAQAPGQTSPLPALATEPAMVEHKDPGVAVLISVGVTTAGFLTIAAAESEGTALLGLAGMWIGPSTGRWYAGNASLSGLGLRGLAGAAMLYGFVNVIESECDYEYEYECDSSDDVGGWIMVAGAGLWIGSTIADVVLARSDAHAYNKRRYELAVSPMRMQTASGSATGLALTGRF